MNSLGGYLDITDEQARSQWGQILRREPKSRQDHFTPVEAILCYALFRVVDPHRFGGATMHRAPLIVHQLASLFVRPPGSVTSKMMNLDGSRRNAGAHEWQFFVAMLAEPDRFPVLYNRALFAARDMGIGPERLPDFLSLNGVDDFDLLGQDELPQRTLDTVIEIKAAQRRAKLLDPASDAETERLVEASVRLGQHRFAKEVLDNYAHACAFCGFAPNSLPRSKLLVASHIKPWAVSDDHERLDPLNGLAACPTHDAAFDTGLLTVNGGLRVHRAPPLVVSNRSDPGVNHYFGTTLNETLVIPPGSRAPHPRYLAWHHQNVFQGLVGH